MPLIRIPATTANIGPGFDTFGMALTYYNYIRVEPAQELSLTITGEGMNYLSTHKNNLIVRSAQAVYDSAGAGPVRLAFEIENNIPLSRGMGSSAGAIVGGMVAANHALKDPFSKEDLLELALRFEKHPDNVAPTLFGGFVAACRDGDQYKTFRFEPPRQLKAVVVIPELRLPTVKSREAIPRNIPLADAVYNLGHSVLLALSLQKGDLDAFALMLKDRLHQPYRFPLIPGAEDVVEKAMAAGAMGCVISGAGSAMIAFTKASLYNDTEIGAAMVKAFELKGIKARYLSLRADNSGAKIITHNINAEE